MDPNKAARKLTEEIIDELLLPRTTSYAPINIRIHMAIGVGFDLGRNMTSGSKPVAKLDENGRLIEVYPSMTAAARDTGISTSAISRYCLGVRTSPYKGFRWKYTDPNNYYKKRKL